MKQSETGTRAPQSNSGNEMPVQSVVLFLIGWLIAVGVVAGLVYVTPPDYRILVYVIAIPLLVVVLASVSGNLRQKIARWTARKQQPEEKRPVS